MAGIFDFLTGGDDPNKQAMLGLLAQGLSQRNGVGGLLAANQYAAQAPARDLERRYREMQMSDLQFRAEDNKAQAEERRQKMEMAKAAQARQDAFLFGTGGAPGAAASVPTGGGLSSIPDSSSPSGALALAQRLGIPPQAIQADIVFNGGKKISEFLEKHGARDMQVTNGYAYDKNQLGAGFMPSISTSQDGKTAMTRIGPDGLPVVSAPQGALDTFNSYQRTQNQAAADYKPMTIPPRAGQQNPTLTTEGAFISGQQPGNLSKQSDMRGAAEGPMGADPDAIRREIQASVRDLTSKPLDPASRQALEAHVQGLTQTLKSIGGQSQVQTAGGIALQSEAEKIAAAKGAEGEAERRNAEASKGSQFKDFRAQLNIAKTLLEAGPTNSTFGSAMDAALGTVGMSTTSANVARSLETASKWLTQNIPKAPGAQSDAELKEYAGATGLVGDRTVPVAQRLAALGTVNKLLDTWEQRRQVTPSGNTPQGKAVRRTGTLPNGRKVIEYADGTTSYAD